MRYLRSFCIIAAHLLRCRRIILNPVSCARLFMDRTPMACAATLKFGPLRFRARKQDMNPVREVLVSGCYDFILPFLKGIRGKPRVLDFGANIGSFALKVLATRPDAQILSVEAARDTHALLADNARRSRADWTCIHAALWDRDGTLALQRSTSSERNTVGEAQPDAQEAVPALKYSSIFKRWPCSGAHIIKMDIEGAEATVIPEAAGEMDAELMIIELHKDVSDPRDCCRALAGIFPFAYVSREKPVDPRSPNIVYCLSKHALEVPGMQQVELLAHLERHYLAKQVQPRG